ncbi:MAG: protein kinase [Planctomycetota bacterium]|nr:protein kinase [Planctomycetota bacterium]
MSSGRNTLDQPPRVTILTTDRELGARIEKALKQRSVISEQSARPNECLQKVLDNPPDALIVDMKLPSTTAIEFYNRIRGEVGLDSPPCLILSDSAEEEIITRAYEAGAADFLVKPVSTGELMAKLRLHVPKLRRSGTGHTDRFNKIGAFKIIEELRRGNMSVLYKATHPRYEGPLALKTLENKKCDLDTLLRFRREVNLLTHLEHPHLAKFCEAGRSRDRFYFAMNFIDGRPLDSVLEEDGALPSQVVLTHLRDLASAIAHLHRHNILHRDIKPANILLSNDKGAVLVDFGLARHIRDQQLTGSHMVIGTPLYIAPECLEKDQTDERSDLFSLGMVGLQMLLGKAPIDGKNLYEIFNRIMLREFPQAKEVPGVCNDLATVIDRLLEIDPKDRFQSADDLVHALENIRSAGCTAS